MAAENQPLKFGCLISDVLAVYMQHGGMGKTKPFNPLAVLAKKANDGFLVSQATKQAPRQAAA